jgi:hypothetical protein
MLCALAGGYHELLHGPEKEDAVRFLTDWILSHSHPPPASQVCACPAGGDGVYMCLCHAADGARALCPVKTTEIAVAQANGVPHMPAGVTAGPKL